MQKTIAKTVFILISIILVLSATACSDKEEFEKSNHDFGSRQQDDPKIYSGKAYGNASLSPKQHDNSFFEYSSAVSYQVSKISGVRNAIVMLTDKNAYAAILLDLTATGARNNEETIEQDNSPATDGSSTLSSQQKRENGKRPAKRFHSYYTVKDHNNLSEELKQMVALEIRKLAPAVQEVHISANLDFINKFNEYAREAWMHRSLAPWIKDFNTTVQFYFDDGEKAPAPIK